MKATLSAAADGGDGDGVYSVKPDLDGLMLYGYTALPFQWSSWEKF